MQERSDADLLKQRETDPLLNGLRLAKQLIDEGPFCSLFIFLVPPGNSLIQRAKQIIHVPVALITFPCYSSFIQSPCHGRGALCPAQFDPATS